MRFSEDPDLERESQALTDALYAPRATAPAWSGDRFVNALSNARTRVLAAGRERAAGAGGGDLPPLNPR